MPTAVEKGESGRALLILWEVDHQRAYPGHGGEGLSGALTGFTKRLQERVSSPRTQSCRSGWSGRTCRRGWMPAWRSPTIVAGR